MWPVVTFQIKYPVGIVPLDGSTATAAGRICIHVPDGPATVQTHSPPKASRPNSFWTRAPDVGGPMIVVGLPFWHVARPGGARRRLKGTVVAQLPRSAFTDIMGR